MKYFILCIIWVLVFAVSSCKKEDKNTDCSVDASNTLFCTTINVISTVNGFVKNYYPDSITIKSEGNYTQGIPTGFWKFYYLNGNLKYEGNYTNQKQNGFCKEYYENGFLKEEGNFTNCIRNGFYKFYHETAQNQVAREGNYSNGIKTGTWKFYNNKGNITETIDYKC